MLFRIRKDYVYVLYVVVNIVKDERGRPEPLGILIEKGVSINCV